MVAIRRVKRLMQFSVLAVFLATILLFLQWNEITDSEELKTAKRAKTSFNVDDQDLARTFIDPEREFDVNEILMELNGNSDAASDDDDDWKTAFNEKAKHQVEKKKNFNGKWRETISRENIDHGDKRKLNQMPNESEALNFTTPSTTVSGLKLLFSLQNDTIQSVHSDKEKASGKASPKIHRKESHVDHLQAPNHTWTKFPWRKNMVGSLNVHIWQACCGSTTHDLRRNRFFPLYPDIRLTVGKFFLRHMQADYGQRIFGYVHPPVSGKYTFAISSDDSSELWLSSDENPSKVKLIAWVGNRTLLSVTFKTKIAQFDKYKTQLSRPVLLHKGQKYFIEALHKQGNLQEHILVGWKIPGSNEFRHLTGSSISAAINDSIASKDVTKYANFIPQDLPSHSHYRTNLKLDQNVYKFGSEDLRDVAHKANFVDERDIENIFPSCPYNPSYLVNFKLKRYEGVHLIHDTSRYPNDYSELSHMRQYDQCALRRNRDSHGNQVSSPSSEPNSKQRLHEDSHGNPKSSLPPNLKFKQRLYEDGSIAVFKNSKVFLPLSFAKSAAEKERVKEQLLEAQMDLLDMKRLSQHANQQAFQSMEDPSFVAGDSSEKIDKKKGSEARERLKRRDSDAVSIDRVKKRTLRKRESVRKQRNSEDKIRHSNVEPQQRSRVEEVVKKRQSRDAPLSSREETPRDSLVRRSNGYVSSKGNQRKLLSLNSKSAGSIDSITVTSNAPRNNKERIANTSSYEAIPTRRLAGRVANRSLHEFMPAEKQSRQKGPFRSYLPVSYNLAELFPEREANSSRNGLQQRSRGRISFYPVDEEDDRMTRMNSAREFVRKMIYAVQMYNHRVNSRTLAEGVRRKFGVALKIPNVVKIPDYNGWIFHQNRTMCASDGNLLLNDAVANSVVNRYMRALRQATNSKYSLKNILNVEENHDVLLGDRYLIDLELNVEGKNSTVRLSQYVYQKIGKTDFCLPEGFVLNQHATVHIIIPVKNQGKWVQHLIDNMVELYLETGDPHVNIIIVDFSSTDIDVEAALERSQLKRYQVRKLKGPFQRAYGIQAGAALVKNPRDIIFMCDLHLQIPSNIVDIIRKHCVQRKMAFAPIVARLHCGFSPSLPFGFWELQGYGLFAMYKSDFTRVGGMNYKEFRTTWGGEDWELLDRVLQDKMEVERLRVPKFYHYFHSKKGMWGSRNLFNSYRKDMFDSYDHQGDTDVITLYSKSKERAEDYQRLPSNERSHGR
ncbi:uncharacterized protein LOC111336201 [Stylophora pistillata]|uniref:uncharacterized protein LOC111336201 n=1 Tax=Stylophora pistillata TaxID=50429 RepID=UPI000C03C58D|nr:uncharacterized protein LOC111336201 [Stylophora pistillata]